MKIQWLLGGMFMILLLAGSACPAEFDYPELYGPDLPRYPNARIISVGRQTESLQDGLRIKLLCEGNIEEVASYYEALLLGDGWEKGGGPGGENGLPEGARFYFATFTMDDLIYRVRAMQQGPDNATTQIEISYSAQKNMDGEK